MKATSKNKEKTLCNICDKNVRENAKAICCDFCENWVHIRCNYISPTRYLQLSEEDNHEDFLCNKCFNHKEPFGLEDNKTLNQATTLGLENSNLENLNDSISKDDKKLINLLGKIVMKNNDPNIKNSILKYYITDNFCSKKFHKKHNTSQSYILILKHCNFTQFTPFTQFSSSYIF